jgi:hypothetical protein
MWDPTPLRIKLILTFVSRESSIDLSPPRSAEVNRSLAQRFSAGLTRAQTSESRRDDRSHPKALSLPTLMHALDDLQHSQLRTGTQRPETLRTDGFHDQCPRVLDDCVLKFRPLDRFHDFELFTIQMTGLLIPQHNPVNSFAIR